MSKRKSKEKLEREVAVLDFETDPFKYGRIPEPFACGVLWRGLYVDFWGTDCWRKAADYLLSIKVPLVVYAHNGGKFDFFFMWPVLENPVKLINSRIVSARLGIHELRDSWAIMPFGLAKFEKTKIDYSKFEPEVRDNHRGEILDYLHDDCVALHTLCVAFVKRFGFRLTIAGTAMHELTQIHPQAFTNENHDSRFRRFYYGGRVECFDSGVIDGRFQVFDVNSMYPAVMRNCDHPSGTKYLRIPEAEINDAGDIPGYEGCFYFVIVEGHNLGALPHRDELNGSLAFNREYGVFDTTSHELRAALELGKFRITRVHEVLIPHEVQRFDEFVETFADQKKSAKKSGDKIGEIFAKLIMNSAYGKFGQDPEHFKDYFICIRGVHSHPGEPWELEESATHWSIWSKPSPQKRYFDVAIAASVTSAARAVLMRGIAGAKRPIYCDTDSIICESLTGVKIDEYELGAWKKEAEGAQIAVAGKKLYALFADDGTPVKWASKGTKLAPEEVRKVAQGGEVLWKSDAPNFKLTGETKFIARVSKKTA